MAWLCNKCGADCESEFTEDCTRCGENPTTDLDFGQALAAMRAGKVVAIESCPSRQYRIARGVFQSRLLEVSTWHTVDVMDATEILATDWRIVEEEEQAKRRKA